MNNNNHIMTVCSNALLRHKIIDNCLRDPGREYTLRDLIDACAHAMKSKNGPDAEPAQKISVRTLQLDLQMMRDKEKGYNAPITVYGQKYYKYKDPAYSIRKAPVRKRMLDELLEISQVLEYYTSFKDLSPLKNAAAILAEELEAKIQQRDPVVSYEGKRNFVGLEYFNILHDAIVNKKSLCIGYHSSRSNNIVSIIFYPMYLKEYKGRWYALGYKDGLRGTYKLPLDRIRDYSYSILPFPQELRFDPGEYFKDIIGVTRLSGEVREIRFLVKNKLAPFIRINPLHASQQEEKALENGDALFNIRIIPNREFYNAIFEYQPHIRIVSPKEIGLQANEAVRALADQLPDYDPEQTQQPEHPDRNGWADSRNLFSDL